ncbi:PKD domain-containing protein [Mucilaginibacter sp. HMF5004]|uniref:PKD domain-containing protein n=1 Tax=Mucilaginibacter rivuli TaxID=2857527 RepID=UPI001C606581|nr:PKD domain-containing protein [Mucilaginibacter rivuli]MBW4889182.1 PKD domain-containing protein [Mucilaginibacter rivuli]
MNYVNIANAQTIAIGNVDAGPYTPGSSIGVPVTISGNACIAQNNTFTLYISSVPNGTPDTQIGTYSGFYTSFVNGVLPATIAPGSYNLEVRAGSPQIVSAKATINVIAGSAVTAKITSQSISSSNQDVFGNCNGRAGNFDFLDQSTSGSTVTASFYNELSHVNEGVLTLNPSLSFPAKTAHYTILVKAVNNGIVATKAYALVNNLVNTSFGATGSNTVCLINGKGTLIYNMDVASANGLQKNYPGNVYNVDWGDGSSNKYTFCEINAVGGQISHDYTTSSCGLRTQGHANMFPVNIMVSSPYCGTVGTQVTSYAKVLNPPNNVFTASNYACVNAPVSFNNTSFPGDDPTIASANCVNEGARYSWYIDGALKATNKQLSDVFAYTFTTTGTHTIMLHLQQSGDVCDAADVSRTICVEAAPKPKFTLTDSVYCSASTVSPTDLSVVDNSCSGNNHQYTWTVTGPQAVAYVNGTNEHSKQPQFVFALAGKYKVMLSIDAPCGAISTETKTILINTNPVIKLSPDFESCGKGHLITFDDKTTQSTTTFSGTAYEVADTYTWTVTGGSYTFQNGTTANSKYPQIFFADFGQYTVTVTHKNNCGTTSASQNINFKQSPTVYAGPDQLGVCPNTAITLAGTITGTQPQSFEWVGGTGTFAPNRNTLNAVYTPSAAEGTTGKVTLTLKAITPNPQPCDVVTSDVNITINPINSITSDAAKTICTGTAVNYQPAAVAANSTFVWVATGTLNASGYKLVGSGAINDIITNTSTTNNAIVTYIVTPVINGCNGIAFTFKVTVTPNPVVNATLANAAVCSSTGAGITLASNLENTTFTWSSTTSGAGVKGNTNQATATAAAKIDDILINTTTTTQTVTYTITPVNTNGCTGTPVVVTVSVLAPPVQAIAGPNENIYNAASYTLKGNAAAPSTGKWTLVSANGPVTFADATQADTKVSGLQSGKQYTFRWTITGAAGCAPTTSDVVITNLATVTNTISFGQVQVCQGTTISIAGSDPTGGDNVYAYKWQNSTDGANWQEMSGQTGHDLTTVLIADTYYRRTVTSGTFSEQSNGVLVKATPQISPNNISGAQTICAGTAPTIINGNVPQGGGAGYSYQWQKSEDNGKSWTDISGATLGSYQPTVLQVTTQFRRNVSTVICSGPFQNSSAAVTVTVNPNAKAEYTFATDRSCAPFVIDNQNINAVDYADRNSTYTWYANGVQIGTGLNFPGYTLKNDGDTVNIRLATTSKFGCVNDVFAHTFGAAQKVTAAFTQDITKNCGTTVVRFTNKSTALNNATYFWDFGNGSTSTAQTPNGITFKADPIGKDAIYTVTLTVTTGCGIKTTTSTVTIKSAPRTIVTPDAVVGCSPFTVNMINHSTGGGTYTYDFGDGQGPVTVADTQTVKHTYNTPKTKSYTIQVTSQSECGIGATQTYVVTVSPNTISPAFLVDAPQLAGCAPWNVTFHNNTTGANTFTYDFGDGTPIKNTNIYPELVNHTFAKGGVYTVKMTATNGCSVIISTQVITVYPQPVPAFTANVTTGCTRVKVSFTNQTQLANNYIWDFGDGTTSTEANPTHVFDYTKSPYTVTLSAQADLGCPGTIVKKAYITVTAPPKSDFTIGPDSVLNYPDKNFTFTNRSQNAVAWRWSFGDGSTSSQQNPVHAYADTGSYKVTLVVYNIQGCADTITRKARIKGTPGQLYMPNAFMPNSLHSNLTTFKAIGSGIKEWRMRIFNNFGQLIWETDKLSTKGEPTEGWDGTVKGQQAQVGVYVWEATATFTNGQEWKGMSYGNNQPKRSGLVNLVR